MPAALRGRGELAASDSKSRALEQFLATVERRAFKVAQIALRHEDDALDAVQDAMLSLVTSYARASRAKSGSRSSIASSTTRSATCSAGARCAVA